MLFDTLNNWIRQSEASLVNLLSAIAPWAAPLAPAYMSFNHMVNELDYPMWTAWAVAIVVEILGLSAISTILAFWAHNRRYKIGYKKAPVWIAVLSFIMYLSVVIMVNVVLDAAKVPGSGLNGDWIIIFARALLTLLSVPAAVILAVRTQHKEVLDSMEQQRLERKHGKSQTRNSVAATPGTGAVSRRKKQFIRDLKNGRVESLNAQELSRIYNVSERTAWRWISETKQKESEGQQ